MEEILDITINLAHRPLDIKVDQNKTTKYGNKT